MADTTRLLYLEPDDEITTVVRRLREADAGRVVLVASGRSKPTTSVVALRLLAQVADEEKREVALVADAAARALAGEAGIAAFASVADASAEDAVPLEPATPRRAPIHVVRGEEQPLAVEPGLATETQVVSRLDETQAVPVPKPAPARPGPARPARARPTGERAATLPRLASRGIPRAALAAVLMLFVAAGALMAAVVPSATIVIVPATTPVGPASYQLTLPPSGTAEGELQATTEGTATGVFSDPTPATGTVVFLNWNTVTVEVPAGTVVAAGDIQFTTVETIVVPSGQFGLPIDPGEGSVGVVASVAGPDGNVAAEAIDTIVTDRVRRYLRGFPNNPNRLVINPEAMAGGSLNEQPEVTQADVDAAVAALREDLVAQLASALSTDPQRIYAEAEPEPTIVVPDGLVGTRGQATFELSGAVSYRVPYLARADVEAAAAERLLGDEDAVPAGMEVLAESVSVEVGDASLDGDQLRVPVEARGQAAAVIDPGSVQEQVAGLTVADARTALAPLGQVTVELWPGWVDRVPQLGWRVDVQVEAAQPSASPDAVGSGGG